MGAGFPSHRRFYGPRPITWPGLQKRQDTRTRVRIHAALRTSGNAYSQSFEALTILLQRPQEEMVDAWWKYNLQTEFFASKHTARLLRHSGS